jgi:glycosyltransferase involved in cell wall biosynthesis
MTGVGKFAYKTIKKIARMRADIKFIIVSDNKMKQMDLDTVEQIIIGDYSIKKKALNKLYSPIWVNTFFKKEITKISPDIIFYPNFVMPIINNSKIKKLAVIHDVIHKSFPSSHSWIYNKYLDMVINNTLANADVITTPSNHSKNELMKYYNDINQEKIKVTYHGIDKDNYNRINLDFNFPYILLVGTHSPRKNLNVVHQAWKNLKQDFPKIKLVIVGKGKFFSELAADNDVILTGYVSEDKLNALYDQAKVFCFPSLYEGFGMPILEAMSHGTPVISANNSSLPEVLGESGLLIKKNNKVEWENAIRKVISDKKLAKNLEQKGKKRAQEFSWENSAKEYIKIFENLLID